MLFALEIISVLLFFEIEVELNVLPICSEVCWVSYLWQIGTFSLQVFRGSLLKGCSTGGSEWYL
jgi:hypothetical protein